MEDLQRESSGLRSSLEACALAKDKLDTDVKLNVKMANKFEELALSLQVRSSSFLNLNRASYVLLLYLFYKMRRKEDSFSFSFLRFIS